MLVGEEEKRRRTSLNEAGKLVGRSRLRQAPMRQELSGLNTTQPLESELTNFSGGEVESGTVGIIRWTRDISITPTSFHSCLDQLRVEIVRLA